VRDISHGESPSNAYLQATVEDFTKVARKKKKKKACKQSTAETWIQRGEQGSRQIRSSHNQVEKPSPRTLSN